MDMLNDTKGIRHQATELIEQAYYKGYKAGLEESKKPYEKVDIVKARKFLNDLGITTDIVYCKDCKFRTDTGICEKLWIDGTDGNIILKKHRPGDNDYCSRAERRSNNANVGT